MSVLLGSTPFLISRPSRQPDAHGWAEEGDLQPAGEVRGSLQPQRPLVDPAYQGSGQGPNRPMVIIRATAYLDGPVREGDRISRPGESPYLVRAVRLIPDLTGSGLDCWEADLSDAPGGR